MNTNLPIHLPELRYCFLMLLLFAFTLNSAAQGSSESPDAITEDFLNVYNQTTGKVAQLGSAIPDDTYSWRPAEGVRSVRESILHVAGANYFFGSLLGTDIPEGVNPQGMEQADMSREEAVAAFNKSVDFVRAAIKTMSADDFDTEVEFFGNTATKRQVMFILGDHSAEHLGQLIAYARSNGVVPPWSQ